MNLFNKLVPQPIGESHSEVIADSISEAIEVWNSNTPESTWWSRTKGVWFSAVNYITDCIDYLIQKVEDAIPTGADKKATVLEGIEELYNAIVYPILPFYLKPFSGLIRKFIINVIASSTIDFIVSKYNDSSWATSS